MASLTTARPAGVIAQPSAPQFSSSQALMRLRRRPKPPGGTATITRTGKRRPASRLWIAGYQASRRFSSAIVDRQAYAPFSLPSLSNCFVAMSMATSCSPRTW
jgi:hypothetical protein